MGYQQDSYESGKWAVGSWQTAIELVLCLVVHTLLLAVNHQWHPAIFFENSAVSQALPKPLSRLLGDCLIIY